VLLAAVDHAFPIREARRSGNVSTPYVQARRLSGDDPMTGAQESYLKTLAEQDNKPDPMNKEMTKAEASELIDQLREEAGLEK
jgi:hypothetical protein